MPMPTAMPLGPISGKASSRFSYKLVNMFPKFEPNWDEKSAFFTKYSLPFTQLGLHDFPYNEPLHMPTYVEHRCELSRDDGMAEARLLRLDFL